MHGKFSASEMAHLLSTCCSGSHCIAVGWHACSESVICSCLLGSRNRIYSFDRCLRFSGKNVCSVGSNIDSQCPQTFIKNLVVRGKGHASGLLVRYHQESMTSELASLE
ncbi:hypothetical protein D5086_013560 [Populus alba]|uniref:Uncharacterized protein n=1 Tax=Populus alba TaxID=43335 RepID=A0ACC4C5Z0_POPAL